MPSPGLDNRLRQHSRRAGLMVGLSMALTIAVCIGSFVWIYAQVEPFTKDFVDAATVAPTTVGQSQREDDEEPEATQPAEEEDVQPTELPEEEPEDDSNVTDPTDDDEEPEHTPTPEEDEFEPTHIVSSELVINFRPGPGVNTGAPVTTLAPGTELEYLGESEASQDPDADGDTQWMQFETEDGLEGWVRQIDVTATNAGQ